MTTRMLIDARHPEETRVAVLQGNRIEEFDFESADHKQIKGNIYLAKVTRVEPSLQAAFVDYGGNRHGFLAFSEIHPDYYQIPREDREKLLAEEAKHAEEEAEARAEEEEQGDVDHSDDDELADSDAFADELANEDASVDADGNEEADSKDSDDSDADADDDRKSGSSRKSRGRRGSSRNSGRGKARASDEARKKRMALRRRYKIQDVIQRRQVLLVQVVKEERGNKGAALTTYLSLAGRYCVLMPNSAHGGGISRKISNGADRKRLKTIIAEMKLPKTMGCIVRTAGLSRTKTEIKRDFDYLARLWDEIRERTLTSSAPANIHSDSDLIKRAIRDIYNREISEVLVEGEDGYRAAKDFMKLLMPSHARRVKSYADPVPLFQRYGAEDQLSAMYEPMVQLKSGGYLVINPTEALVSIDINSGRSTKEHGIEQTALSTNLEAAKEIARQLRLRDMAGLVVIDFIDMDYGSNVRKVEKAMKDALKNDRARIQVGRISGFGLMEMSRQRLRTGMLEASTRVCPHCDGTGLVRTASSAGLSAVRLLEEEASKGKGSQLELRTSQEAMIFVLNSKRQNLADIEQRYGVSIEILPDGAIEGAKMEVSSSGPKPSKVMDFQPIVEEDEDELEETRDDVEEQRDDSEQNDDGDRQPRKRRRRRRGRRGRRDNQGDNQGDNQDSQDNSDGNSADNNEAAGDKPDHGKSDHTDTSDEEAKPKARRGRRGGRRSKSAESAESNDNAAVTEDSGNQAQAEQASPVADTKGEAGQKEEKPKRTRRKKAEPKDDAAEITAKETPADEPAPKPKRTRRKAPAKAATEEKASATPSKDTDAPTGESEKTPSGNEPKKPRRRSAAKKTADTSKETKKTVDASAGDEESSGGSKRGGWWQRTFGN